MYASLGVEENGWVGCKKCSRQRDQNVPQSRENKSMMPLENYKFCSLRVSICMWWGSGRGMVDRGCVEVVRDGGSRRARNEMGEIKPDQEQHLCHFKEFEYYLEDNWEIINEF